MGRYSFYQAHKFVAFTLSNYSREIAKTDFKNNIEINKIKEQLKGIKSLMHGHAEHKNNRIHPLLKRKGSTLYEKIEAEHAGPAEIFESLEQIITDIQNNEDGDFRIELGHKFYLSFQKFEAENLLHQIYEETVIMPALQSLYTDEELLAEVEAKSYEMMTPEQMVYMMQVLFPHFNPSDREVFLTDIYKSQPQKFSAAWIGIKESIDKIEQEQLLKKIGAEIQPDAKIDNQKLYYDELKNSNNLNMINKDIAQLVARFLPFSAIASLSHTSKSNYILFQPLIDEAKKALLPLTCVARGDCSKLVELIKDNPTLLFKKGQITDPRKRTFYHVSAYQLMMFLCDDDMQNKILPLVPEALYATCQIQYSEIDSGGADLIKINIDPECIDFKKIVEFESKHCVLNQHITIRLPLLENLDGIIYYQDTRGFEHFYYANQLTQTVKLIKPHVSSQEEQEAFDKLKTSFAEMENNSARRSSDQEHWLITQIFQCQLKRKGIRYKWEDISYHDSCTEFRLIKAYQKCIRLYNEAAQKIADEYWCKGLGMAQGEEIWVLQRLCERQRPFYPLQPEPNFNCFKREELVIYNWLIKNKQFIFSDGALDVGLGSNFALYKANVGMGTGHPLWRGPQGPWALESGSDRKAIEADLIAICQLIGIAKANTIKNAPRSINEQEENTCFSKL